MTDKIGKCIYFLNERQAGAWAQPLEYLVSGWKPWVGGLRWRRPCRNCHRCWWAAGHHARPHSRWSPRCWWCGGCARRACRSLQTSQASGGPERTFGTQLQTRRKQRVREQQGWASEMRRHDWAPRRPGHSCISTPVLVSPQEKGDGSMGEEFVRMDPCPADPRRGAQLGL